MRNAMIDPVAAVRLARQESNALRNAGKYGTQAWSDWDRSRVEADSALLDERDELEARLEDATLDGLARKMWTRRLDEVNGALVG